MVHSRTKFTRTEKKIINSFNTLSAATVYEASGRKGYVNPAIKSLSRGTRICGSVFTVQCDAGDNLMLHKALQEEPENPRAQLLMAYNTYYTPSILGGGPVNALPMFIKARDRFNTFKPEFEFAPRWGEEETLHMIQICTNESTGQ